MRTSTQFFAFGLMAVISFLPLTGCGPSQPTQAPGPSYAELVSIYNGELETLDRLQQQKQDIVNQFQRQLAELGGQRSQSLSDVLQAAQQMQGNVNLDDVLGDPQQTLDRAAENAAQAQELAGNLLNALASPQDKDVEEDEETVRKKAQIKSELEKQLEGIDRQIDEQKARVDRAREARDAAQPVSP